MRADYGTVRRILSISRGRGDGMKGRELNRDSWTVIHVVVLEAHCTGSSPIELDWREQEGEPAALVSWGFEEHYSIFHGVN